MFDTVRNTEGVVRVSDVQEGDVHRQVVVFWKQALGED